MKFMNKEAMYDIVSPDGQTVLKVDFASARDLVKNMGWAYAKGAEVVTKVAQADADSNAYVNGNDPRKTYDVDAIQAMYDGEGDWLTTLSKDELVKEATNRAINVDKRWGRERLIEEIRKSIEAVDEDDDE